MSRIEVKWLCYVAMLALGEGVGFYLSRGAYVWPVAAMLALFIALMGYGYRLRGWTYLAVAVSALALALHASLAHEEELRRSPWLRDRAPRPSASCAMMRPLAEALRADLSARVGLGLDAARETAVLNRAILLGERSNIPKATKQIFIESGTIHVFAISGLHVMIVARLFMFLIALVFVPYRLQGVVALPLVWGYVLLIGASPSAVRAATMATFYLLAPILSRRPNGLVSWALAFLLAHLVNPLQIADVGSQLSFAVMLALILASRQAGGFFITFAAWAAGVPIAAMVFGRITPGGLIANLVLLVTAGYSVVAGAVGALVSYLSETLAIHFNNLSALFTDSMVVVSNVVARLPGANFEIEPWGFFECTLWYVAFALGLVLLSLIRARRNLV